jgi:photosystem II stability/assembly factor-like uncharacterized protein
MAMVTASPRALYKPQTIIIIYMLLLMLLLGATPLPVVAQAQYRDLQWTEIEKPGLDGNVVVNPSDISDIAIGSNVFYAIDINQARIYRSMSGGLRWEEISSHLNTAGAALPATEIAIAPDEAAIIAAATDAGTSLYLSVDGGITWGNVHIGAITGSIQSIAISKPYGENNEQRDVLVGTALFGDGITSGQVWLLHLGSVIPYWKNLDISVDPSHIGGEVSAVAFSPKYTDDQAILAIASTDSDVAPSYRNRTFLCIGSVDLAASTAIWNSISGYPVEIFDPTFYPTYLHSSGDGPGVTLITGALELPSSFTATGTSGASRMLYAFYAVQPAPVNDTSNVYRIDDMAVNKATAFRCGSGTNRYSSIALSGKTLLAGEIAPSSSLTVPVRICLDATATSPVFSLTGYPYGPGNAKVAWNSNVAYCGTGKDPSSPPGPPDESGFSISNDSGLNWVQVGLIDTTVLLQDVAVASSPQSIFITSTSSSNVESLWRSAGKPLGEYWGRVLVIDVPSNKIIVRISPHYHDDYTLYVCEAGQGPGPPAYNQLWATNDRGNAWNEYTAPVGVIDLAVADKKVLYVALPGGIVSRSHNGGRSWSNSASTDLTDIAMLSLVEPDTIFVGGYNGYVAYSSDNGTNYTLIPDTITDTGPVQVVADTGYQDNNLIYAASGNTIYRWTIGQSEHWEAIRTADTGSQITGMVTVDGILYGAWYTAASGSGAERSLGPALRLEKLEWDTLRAGASAAKFDSMPTSLRYSTTETSFILWTIDSISSNLMVYFDCLAWKGPELTMDDNAMIGCDPVTGRNQEINFTWNDICADNRYQFQIAKASNFTLVVYDSGDSYPFLLPAMVTAPAVYFPAGGEANSYGTSDIAEFGNLECGHTYYWRVRARSATTGDIIRSPWSEVRSFLIKIGLPVSADCYGPELLTPDNGCLGCSVNPASFSWSPLKETSEYKFVLAKDATMTQIVAEAEVPTTAFEYRGRLAYGSNYFWRVMATAPFVSDWSATFSFQTEPAQTKPLTTSTEVSASATPLWVWIVMGLGSISVVVVMLLILSEGRNR